MQTPGQISCIDICQPALQIVGIRIEVMQQHSRRASDRDNPHERRAIVDRRRDFLHVAGTRFPGWQEQKVQFLTRYLFLFLGVVFFNFSDEFKSGWLSLAQLNAIFGLYFIINSLCFAHAHAFVNFAARYRAAMWIDVVLVAVCVLHDPYSIPPSLLVFIMVVLGNGMRYGMRLFGEALTGSFAGAMLALGLRNIGSAEGLTPGVLFLNLFGGIILIYAYILMSRIEASRRELERQSNIDTLTGLINRRALFEIAPPLFERLRKGENLVVMFADLDKFKAVNDTYGHATGDEVLQEFAALLRACMRSTDIAARFGGDEFVLLLPNTLLEEATAVAERLRTQTVAFAQRKQINLSISIGLGEAPTHGYDLAGLLAKVDQAMYRSKSDGACIGVHCLSVPEAG